MRNGRIFLKVSIEPSTNKSSPLPPIMEGVVVTLKSYHVIQANFIFHKTSNPIDLFDLNRRVDGNF